MTHHSAAVELERVASVHLHHELAVVRRQVGRVEDDLAVEVLAGVDGAGGGADGESGAALAQDRAPGELGRVVQRVVERDDAANPC